MSRFPFLFVAALLGAAVSIPAQALKEVRKAARTPSVVASSRVPQQANAERRRESPRREQLEGRRSNDHRHSLRDRHSHVHLPLPIPVPIRVHLNDRRDHSHGHWDTIYEDVLVPGYWHEEHVPPTYGWIYERCGARHWGIVDAGGCRRVWIEARCERRARRVWVPC